MVSDYKVTAMNSVSGVSANEPLLHGFSLLRLAQQLLNPDIYYIGLVETGSQEQEDNDAKSEITSGKQTTVEVSRIEEAFSNNFIATYKKTAPESLTNRDASNIQNPSTINVFDDFACMNPLQKYLNSSRFFSSLFRLVSICLSLIAIMISIDKTISTIVLCLFSRSDIRRQSALSGKPSMPYEASDISMSWFVLVLVNLSSTYIILSTVFNGRLLWSLLNQRLFLVGRYFQYKVMLSLLVFAYLEYIVNISFINNLFAWSFLTDDIESNGKMTSINLHHSYSLLSRLEIFVTDQDDKNGFIDLLLTIMQFSRGFIRISPYITICYIIICLKEHIKTIRNQELLIESLKRKQKLRLVVKSSRAGIARASGGKDAKLTNRASTGNGLGRGRSKKRVIFATDASEALNNNNITNGMRQQTQLRSLVAIGHGNQRLQTLSPISSIQSDVKDGELINRGIRYWNEEDYSSSSRGIENTKYTNRIRDFYELESYITNLYIFTGRLNRLMSRQGLAMFFIVHNLVISCSLIVPEAIRGGTLMVYFIRVLVIIIGIVPFRCGQSLNGQLGQLSKQIDRIIIQQQFFGRRRDNLVRIRELLHDIRVNCAGMLNFNIETGLKYLVIAFASAFFIEQEGKLVNKLSYYKSSNYKI